ncbi:MAG TPA: hypothetical protein VMW16_15830 [Sedimentisphaerales bacterium]|nr:hypothetical protein [Sedimentisphaerales bacterium]
MQKSHRNIYVLTLLVLLTILVLCCVVFYALIPSVYGGTVSAVLRIARLTSLLIWAGLLITIAIIYTRKENKIRNTLWRNRSAIEYKNIYALRLILLFGLMVLIPPILYQVIPTAFGGNPPKSVLLIGIFFFFTTLTLLIATMVMYGYEKDRITQTAYVSLAKQLGCNEATLNTLKFGNRRWAGVWAEVTIDYKGHPVRFVGENAGRRSGVGQFPCFLLAGC